MATPVIAPRAARPSTDPIIFDIQVANGDSTAVVADPGVAKLIEGDHVQFTSNQPDTAIKFVVKSPFNDPAPHKAFPVGLASDVVTVSGTGKCKFLCGHIVAGAAGDGFIEWGGGGSHTP